jgi:hypothetical protein
MGLSSKTAMRPLGNHEMQGGRVSCSCSERVNSYLFLFEQRADHMTQTLTAIASHPFMYSCPHDATLAVF